MNKILIYALIAFLAVAAITVSILLIHHTTKTTYTNHHALIPWDHCTQEALTTCYDDNDTCLKKVKQECTRNPDCIGFVISTKKLSERDGVSFSFNYSKSDDGVLQCVKDGIKTAPTLKTGEDGWDTYLKNKYD